MSLLLRFEQMRVREAWEGMRGEIAQALESGDLRHPDALALQRHARNLGCLDGGEVLRCIAAIAAQDLALLQEVPPRHPFFDNKMPRRD